MPTGSSTSYVQLIPRKRTITIRTGRCSKDPARIGLVAAPSSSSMDQKQYYSGDRCANPLCLDPPIEPLQESRTHHFFRGSPVIALQTRSRQSRGSAITSLYIRRNPSGVEHHRRNRFRMFHLSPCARDELKSRENSAIGGAVRRSSVFFLIQILVICQYFIPMSG